jgi:hypothetical protein
MKTETVNGMTVLIPDEGKVITNVDGSAVYEGQIYLGKMDSASNYREIDKGDIIPPPTEEEKNEALKILGVEL